MKKNFIPIFLITLFLGFLWFPKVAGAIIELDNPLAADSLAELIDRFINLIFYVGIVFAPIMFLVGGFYFMTAAGDPQKIAKARNIMIYTAIGLGVVLLAKALVNLIKDLLGVEEPAAYFKNIYFFGTIGMREKLKSLLLGFNRMSNYLRRRSRRKHN